MFINLATTILFYVYLYYSRTAEAWQRLRADERLRKEALLNGEQRAAKGFLKMVQYVLLCSSKFLYIVSIFL